MTSGHARDLITCRRVCVKGEGRDSLKRQVTNRPATFCCRRYHGNTWVSVTGDVSR